MLEGLELHDPVRPDAGQFHLLELGDVMQSRLAVAARETPRGEVQADVELLRAVIRPPEQSASFVEVGVRGVEVARSLAIRPRTLIATLRPTWSPT